MTQGSSVSDVGQARVLRGLANASAASADPYGELIARIGDAPIVMVGEASHGTHEFYRERAALTQRLIEEKGFAAVALEADWPDALRVGRYVAGRGHDGDAVEALGGFERFPTWMWRNADVVDFVGWLRDRNDRLAPVRRTLLYGLDLYSLRASMEAVVAYLERIDPPAAARARESYGCFDFVGEPAEYGYGVRLGLRPSCRDDVMRELVALRRSAAAYAHLDGATAADEFFYAEQNARVARDAEEYYRTMLDSDVSSWNLRDRHMFETLEALAVHLQTAGRVPKIVVWAHNSHVGNGAATEMAQRGEFTIGGLARARLGRSCVLIGFTTYEGTVSAASDWGSAVERKRVRTALPGSCEALFHDTGAERFALVLSDPETRAAIPRRLLQRAIGVVYRPQTERFSHYFWTDLSEQFDAVIHIDRTRAVEPLERGAMWDAGEVPETFPSGV